MILIHKVIFNLCNKSYLGPRCTSQTLVSDQYISQNHTKCKTLLRSKFYVMYCTYILLKA